ncbi:MAG: type II toxin-antitoxin system HicB family antitoxin [Pseudomonadota bacterium]|nr:type II toxin-antitoxin system HicB family antitoxin [Pseudomonadota bacterium]
MRYAVVIEKAGAGFSAYVPDLPGCVAAGPDVEHVERLIHEAIAFHLEGLREDGFPVPQPVSRVEYMEVAA